MQMTVACCCQDPSVLLCSLIDVSLTFAMSRIFEYLRSTLHSHINFSTSKYLHDVNSKSLFIVLSIVGSK